MSAESDTTAKNGAAESGSLLSSEVEPRSSGDYLVPARRWRPKTFAELVGQEPAVKALQNGLDANRVHHAFLFTGTRGVGKTTLARILAKCLNCETGVSADPCGECGACVAIDEGRFVDLIEVDAASRTRVEDTRELLDNVQFAPTSGRYKIYLIDEVHMLSGHSFNALLKTLEEPPPHVKFILATTDPQKLPVTILSRCLRFNLRRVDAAVMQAFMQQKLQGEGLAADETALGYIAMAADGSVRDALSLLDQALSYCDDTLQPDAVMTMLGMVSDQYMSGLLQALVTGDAAGLLQVCAEINATGNSPARVLAQLAQALHRVSLLQMLPDYDLPGEPDMPVLKSISQQLKAEDVQLFYQIAVKGQEDLKLAPDPRIGLEMTLMRMLVFRPPRDHSAPDGGSDDDVTDQPARGHKQEQSADTGHDAAAQASLSPSVPAPAPAQTAVSPPAAAVEKPDLIDAGMDAQARRNGQLPAASLPPTHAVSEQTETASWCDLTPQQWPRWCAKLELQGATLVLANHLQLQATDSDSATLKFLLAADDEHLRNEHSIDELRQSLAASLHTDCRLHIELSHEPLTTPANVAAAADDEKHQQALLAVQQDPVIHAMLQTFDAEIVPGSVKPSTLH